MPDVGGGRIVLDVLGDVTGLREDVQARVNAAVEGVRIRVRVELDDSGLRQQVEAAARLAEAGEQVRVRADLAAEGLREKVDRAVAEAELGEVARVDVGLREAAVERLHFELARVAREASIGVESKVGVDTSQKGEAFAVGEGLVVNEIANAGTAATSAAGGFSLFSSAGLAAFAAVVTLTGGITALVGVLGGLLGGIAPVAGALATIPGMVGVGGAVFGTFAAGLSGIGKAVTGLGKQQAAGGQSAQSYADAQRSAAERVQQATQSLGNTEYEVARQRITDAHGVVEAEYQLATAQRAARQAQVDLNQARADAVRQLQDMQNQAKDAALAAQGAQLDLEQARMDYAQVLADPNATKLQREQSQLALLEAEQRLKESKQQADRSRSDNAKVQKEGVSGNAQVRSAVQAVADAHHRVQDAIYAERQADEQRARDGVTGAQRLADAERQVADALRAQTEAEHKTGAAATAAQSALDKLSPAGRRFAVFLRGVIDGPLARLRRIGQENLLPGLQSGLEKVLGPGGLWPQFDGIVAKTGRALGGVANRMGTVFSSREFRGFLDQLGGSAARITTSFGGAFVHLAQVFRIIAQAALPLLERWARGIDRITGGWEKSMRGFQKSGALKRFFDEVGKATHAWGQILGNVGRIIFGVLKAAVPAGNALNDSLVKTTGHFAKWVNSAAGQNRIRKFFSDAVPVARALGHAIGALVRGILSIANNPAWANLFGSISRATPAVAGFFRVFGGGVIGEIVAIVRLLSNLASVAGPLAGPLGGVAVAIANVVVATKGFNAVRGGVHDAIAAWKGAKQAFAFLTYTPAYMKAAAAATKVWTAAQWLFNAAMDANPIVLIVIAVIAIGVAIYEAYKHFKPFREIVQAVGRFLKDIFLKAIHAVVDAFRHWRDVLHVVTSIFGKVVDFFKKLPGRILDGIKALGGMIADFFTGLGKAAWNLIKKAIDLWVDVYVKFPWRVIKAVWHFIEDIGKFFGRVFSRVFNAVSNGIKDVVSFFGKLPGRIISAIGDLARKLWYQAKWWLIRLVAGLGEKLWSIIHWFQSLPGKIFDALGDLGKMLLDAGKKIMEGLWNGLKDGWHKVTGWLGNLNPVHWFNDINVELGHAEENLVPMGEAVMGGLQKGMAAGWKQVSSWLSTIDPSVAVTAIARAAGGNLGKVTGALRTRLRQTLAWLESHPGQAAAWLQAHPTLAADVQQAYRQAQVYKTGLDTDVGSGLAGAIATGVRDIIVHNPIPELASTSVATRLRRLRVLKQPVTRFNPVVRQPHAAGGG